MEDLEIKQKDLVILTRASVDIKNIMKKYNLNLSDINQVLAMVVADDSFHGNIKFPKS